MTADHPPAGLKQRVVRRMVSQFMRPRGLGGHLAGLGDGAPLLESPAQPLGRLLAGRAAHRPGAGDRVRSRHRDRRPESPCRSRLCGGDRSLEVMVHQARRRNAAAVRAGRVDLRLGSVAALPDLGGPKDKILAVNSVGFWPDPVASLTELRARLRPGGRIAIASQPRCPGATSETSERAAREIETALQRAGFLHPRIETLPLDPPVACVIAAAPGT
jgi:SAM-dependent methyltransferase